MKAARTSSSAEPAHPGPTHPGRGALLSLALALTVLALKSGAYLLTGSVALLSDAAESVVNVAAAVVLIFLLRLARLPPDYRHPYGHTKAEYLSSALEGGLILLAAGTILLSAGERLLEPQPLSAPLAGVVVALAATALNGAGAFALGRLARRSDSVALAANARHLWTDVWTSLGVIAALVLVTLTHWLVLDPLIAALVALNIVREGWRVLSGASSSLLDVRLPDGEERLILEVLDAQPLVLGYHRLRSRRSGAGRFAEVDVFVAPSMTVSEAHELTRELEAAFRARLPGLISTIHIEPVAPGTREGSRAPREEFGA